MRPISTLMMANASGTQITPSLSLHQCMYVSPYIHTHKRLRMIKFDNCNHQTLMLGHGGSSAGSYLADPTSPIPSHCAVMHVGILCMTLISDSRSKV